MTSPNLMLEYDEGKTWILIADTYPPTHKLFHTKEAAEEAGKEYNQAWIAPVVEAGIGLFDVDSLTRLVLSRLPSGWPVVPPEAIRERLNPIMTTFLATVLASLPRLLVLADTAEPT